MCHRFLRLQLLHAALLMPLASLPPAPPMPQPPPPPYVPLLAQTVASRRHPRERLSLSYRLARQAALNAQLVQVKILLNIFFIE